MDFFSALNLCLNHSKRIYRKSLDHVIYEFDGSEGAKYNIWMQNSALDESTPNAKFGFKELVAKDWEYL